MTLTAAVPNAAVEVPPSSSPVDEPLTLTVTVGPRNAYTDPQSGLRFYRWQGRDLVSVTSVRRTAGIPHGLHQWTINRVVERAIDGWESVSSILTREKRPRERALEKNRRQEAAAYLRAGATEERDLAAALGTAVHDAAAMARDPEKVPEDVAPRLRQYLDWLRASGAVVVGSEFQTWNLTLGYAGTADLLCRFPDGAVWLVDIKTGKGVYGDHALQLMAYLMAEFVGEDDRVNDELTGLLRSARGMAVLHLADDHWEFRAVRADPETWRAFRGLLAFGEWSRAHQEPASFTTGVRKGAWRR